jgi:hypothetical protein
LHQDSRNELLTWLGERPLVKGSISNWAKQVVRRKRSKRKTSHRFVGTMLKRSESMKVVKPESNVFLLLGTVARAFGVKTDARITELLLAEGLST